MPAPGDSARIARAHGVGHVLLAALALGLAGCAGDRATDPGTPVTFADCVEPAPYWPTQGWRSTCPARLDLDSTRLRAADDAIRARIPTAYSFVVARRGWIVMEAYYHGASRATVFDLRSVTKGVTATVVGAAVQRGTIADVRDPVRRYLPEYFADADDPRKRGLTVLHLLDLSAGFDMGARGSDTRDAVSGALSRPFVAEPGTRWQYDEVLYQVLSVLVGRAGDRSALEVAARDVFAPMGVGMSTSRWGTDTRGNPWGATGIFLTARELLKLGHLYLNDGVWDGTRVLPDGWVRAVAARPDGTAPGVTLWSRGWRQTMLAGELTYYLAGHGGQHLIVVPRLQLAVVATATADVAAGTFAPFLEPVRDHVIPAAR